MTDSRPPEMYLHEGAIGSDGKHCDSGGCWCWDEFAATVEAPLASNELVTSLRSARVCNTLGHKMLMHRAADEIERLTREYEAYQREASSENDRLRAALQQARALLRSDSVEYDDLRNLNQILDATLSGEPASAVETAGKPPHCINCHCAEAEKGMV